MADTRARIRIEGEDATAAAWRSATGRAASSGREMASAFKSAFGGILAGGFIASQVKQVIDLGDNISRLSKVAGINATAFQELAYAGKQADVEMGSLSQAIGKLQRNISENGKATSQALTAIGLSAGDLEGMGADRMLERIADGISALRDPADKSRAAVALFGKSGADLLPMFEDGSRGIRAFRQEAHELGGVLSDEGVKSLSEYDAGLKKLQATWQSLVATVVTGKAGGLGQMMLDGTRSLLGGKTELERIDDTLEILKRFRDDSGGMVNVGGFAGLEDGFYTPDELKAVIAKFEAQRTALLRMQQIASGGGFRGRGAGKEGSAAFAPGFLGEVFGDGKRALDQLAADIKAAEALTRTSEEKYLASLQEFLRARDLLLEHHKIDMATAEARTLEFITANLPKLPTVEKGDFENNTKAMAEAFKTTTDDMSVYAEEGARNIQDYFAQFLFDPFKGGLRGMAAGLANTLRRMAADIAASQIIELMQGLFDDGTAKIKKKKNIFGTIFGTLFGGGRATGGPVSGGMSYLVGEEGPEMLTLGRGQSGTVTPNRKLREGSGGGGVTLAPVYNFNGTGVSAEQLLTIMGRNNQDLMRRLADAQRRSGLPVPRF